MLNRARTVQHALGGKVSLMRLLWGVKGADMFDNAGCLYRSGPFLPFPSDAKITGCVGGTGTPLVLCITRRSNVSQVAENVVGGIAVAVVNDVNGPCSGHIKPRDAMGKADAALDRDFYPASGVNTANQISSGTSFTHLDLAREYAGIWVVVNQFAQTICRKWRFGTRSFLGDRPVSQVINPVVASVLVSVSNVSACKRTVDVQPRKMMRLIGPSININNDVSVGVYAPSHAVFSCGSASHKPSKYTSLGVVMKKLFEPFLREGMIQISHAVSPVKKWFGQKPRCVSSTSGLRHFTIGAS